EMDVTIDQTGEQREPAPVNASGTPRNGDGTTGTRCVNFAVADNHRCLLYRLAIAIDESHMVDRNDHGQLPIGNVMMIPPMTSFNLKSRRGLFGCRLWQSTQAWETARSAYTA